MAFAVSKRVRMAAIAILAMDKADEVFSVVGDDFALLVPDELMFSCKNNGTEKLEKAEDQPNYSYFYGILPTTLEWMKEVCVLLLNLALCILFEMLFEKGVNTPCLLNHFSISCW